MNVVETPGYAAALRRRMLDQPLTADDVAVLESGRRAAGYPDGRYPLPPLPGEPEPEPERINGHSYVEPPPPRPTRAERTDPSVAELVSDAARWPACPVRQYRPDPG